MILSACIQVKELLFPWRKELVSYLHDEGLLRSDPPSKIKIDEAEEFGFGQKEWQSILNDFADSGRILQAKPEALTLQAIQALKDFEVAPLFQISGVPHRAIGELVKWLRLHDLDEHSLLVGPADHLASLMFLTSSEDDAWIFSEVNRARGLGMAFVVNSPEHVLKVVNAVVVDPVQMARDEEDDQTDSDGDHTNNPG